MYSSILVFCTNAWAASSQISGNKKESEKKRERALESRLIKKDSNRPPPPTLERKHMVATQAWKKSTLFLFRCVNFLTRFQIAAYFHSKRINLNPFFSSFGCLLTTSVGILQWQLITVRPTVFFSLFVRCFHPLCASQKKNRNFEQKTTNCAEKTHSLCGEKKNNTWNETK